MAGPQFNFIGASWLSMSSIPQGRDPIPDPFEFAKHGYGLKTQRCPVCRSTDSLLRCGGCKAVSYCGAAHQSAHRPKHKTACEAVQTTRQALEREEAALRANPGDGFMLPADVFNTCVGDFWGIFGTRDYMRARFAAADALIKLDTKAAVEKAVEHFNDMLRLCRSDNLGVRDIVPSLLLRLDREQECYDFLKSWATKNNHDGVRNANVFESVDMFCAGHLSLQPLVALTLLKLRLFLDLQAYDPEFGFGIDFDEPDRPVGRLVRSRIQNFSAQRLSNTIETLKDQYHRLCRAVNDANPHFWDALVDDGEEALSPPGYYSPRSVEEARLALYRYRKAWEESEDAIVMIEDDTASFVPVYRGPSAVMGAGDVASAAPRQRTESLERTRGVGAAFPSKFKPSLPTSSPADLFAVAATGGGKNIRYVSIHSPRTILVYVDGACSNNGQTNPLAGWAVAYSPVHIASGRLEDKGPFGDHSVATSNRAELRATIAAMRLCDWRREDVDSIIIATDSSYVVDGATGWTKGWVRNGWKTRNGGDVKNRDLWEMLLGEVERWQDRGVRVAFWRIPRELNSAADAAAKAAAANGAAEAEFRDVEAEISQAANTTTNMERGSNTRILVLCLENEGLFDRVYGGLAARIVSKAEIERAAAPSAAFDILHRQPPPSVILVTDGALTRQKTVFEHVIDHLRGGAIVVLCGCFSSGVTMGQLDRFFTRLGLPWRRGSYHRTTVRLRRQATSTRLASRLTHEYSQKALFLKNVNPSDTWYTEPGNSEAAVAFAQVGAGKLGYVGDVNGEAGSEAAVLAMCGLLD